MAMGQCSCHTKLPCRSWRWSAPRNPNTMIWKPLAHSPTVLNLNISSFPADPGEQTDSHLGCWSYSRWSSAGCIGFLVRNSDMKPRKHRHPSTIRPRRPSAPAILSKRSLRKALGHLQSKAEFASSSYLRQWSPRQQHQEVSPQTPGPVYSSSYSASAAPREQGQSKCHATWLSRPPLALPPTLAHDFRLSVPRSEKIEALWARVVSSWCPGQ